MKYKHPDTGRWISEAEYNRIIDARELEEPEPIDYADDEYDWDFETEEGEYEA
jgi:hypothetical protein